MSDLIARSPIAPVEPTAVSGWQVSGLRAAAGLTVTDLTPLAKVAVRARPDGVMARALGVPFGRAARDGEGALVIGAGPGEWLVLGSAGTERALAGRMEETAAGTGGQELVSVIDLTHGRALVRLTGAAACQVLAKVCGIDLGDDLTPDGSAFRSEVAGVVTDVVRDDTGVAARSYLLHCERASGQYLFDVLLDAGAEFGISVGGFRAPGW